MRLLSTSLETRTLLAPLGASLVMGAIVSAIAGCVIESSSTGSGSGSGGSTPSGTSTAPAPTSPPPLLSLDTGRSLTATPGDGAGVFVTYQPGGHWSLQWTCDTNSSGYSCAFDVSASASAISDYAAVPQTATVSQTAQSFRAQTDTASTLDGVTFDTPPGAPIVLSATINGRPMPSLVFYVTNGKLQTAPTDPVEFVPTSP
jgi:hypothetical protein